MRNPTRRNRNIGTSKQGHGRNNEFKIPSSWRDSLLYFEKIEDYSIVTRVIANKEYTFIVEKTRLNSFHSCTIDDISRILEFIPENDLFGLNIIVLRQPKRKEEILEPVWGRLRYFAELANRFIGPCIMLEAIDISRRIIYGRKSQTPEQQNEFKRIIRDGHIILKHKSEYIYQPTISCCRNTQLYRTLLHEIGHYVQYLECTVRKKCSHSDQIDYEEL